MLVARKPGSCIFCALKASRQISTTRTTSSRFRRSELDTRGSNTPNHRRKERTGYGQRPWGPHYERIERQSIQPDTFASARGQHGHIVPLRGNNERKIEQALEKLGEDVAIDPFFDTLELSPERLQSLFEVFRKKVEQQLNSNSETLLATRLFGIARRRNGQNDLYLTVKYSFFGEVVANHTKFSKRINKQNMMDLRYPQEWFPRARTRIRNFHLHVGPTNSGKTYQALKRLEQAEFGIYAGPLRLLAHEVYLRLNAQGKRCNLVTGDDRRAADNEPVAPMSSCTVEMLPLSSNLDVAVIDEIQLIGSDERGWAWTNAVLGVNAKEVHLCGEERTVPIIQQLVAMCGDTLEIHRYSRLSPLKMMPESLSGDVRGLEKGDCVVAFSVPMIHGLRQIIEKTMKKNVAVIYGALPPETRAQQAALFNDPDNDYDYLVASNAVGMGLNLSIKRMIFQSSTKAEKTGKMAVISVPDIKQIAGRAGRFSTARQDIDVASTPTIAPSSSQVSPSDPVTPPKQPGLVTTLEDYDYDVIANAMRTDPEPILSAGLKPPHEFVLQFALLYPPNTPLSQILIQLSDIALTNGRFHLCDLEQTLSIADVIQPVENLTTIERLIFTAAPIEPKKSGEPELAREYARCIASGQKHRIVDIMELDFELLKEEYRVTRDYLRELEKFHKGVIIFLWLSYRFTNIFMDRDLATHVKELVETRIAEVLEKFSFDYEQLQRQREKRAMEALQQDQEQQKAGAQSEQLDAKMPSLNPTSNDFDADDLKSDDESFNAELETRDQKILKLFHEDSKPEHDNDDIPRILESLGDMTEQQSMSSDHNSIPSTTIEEFKDAMRGTSEVSSQLHSAQTQTTKDISQENRTFAVR